MNDHTPEIAPYLRISTHVKTYIEHAMKVGVMAEGGPSRTEADIAEHSTRDTEERG